MCSRRNSCAGCQSGRRINQGAEDVARLVIDRQASAEGGVNAEGGPRRDEAGGVGGENFRQRPVDLRRVRPGPERVADLPLGSDCPRSTAKPEGAGRTAMVPCFRQVRVQAVESPLALLPSHFFLASRKEGTSVRVK